MPIDGDEVRKITRLARLDLDASKLETFCHQLESILDYIAVLEEVDVDTSAPGARPAGGGSGLRSDEPRSSLSVSEALSNAPDPGDGHFRVPRILKK